MENARRKLDTSGRYQFTRSCLIKGIYQREGAQIKIWGRRVIWGWVGTRNMVPGFCSWCVLSEEGTCTGDLGVICYSVLAEASVPPVCAICGPGDRCEVADTQGIVVGSPIP